MQSVNSLIQIICLKKITKIKIYSYLYSDPYPKIVTTKWQKSISRSEAIPLSRLFLTHKIYRLSDAEIKSEISVCESNPHTVG